MQRYNIFLLFASFYIKFRGFFLSVKTIFIFIYNNVRETGEMKGEKWERWREGSREGWNHNFPLFKGFSSEGREGWRLFWKFYHFYQKSSSTSKIVWPNLLDDSHFGNGMFPHWELNIPKVGIYALPMYTQRSSHLVLRARCYVLHAYLFFDYDFQEKARTLEENRHCQAKLATSDSHECQQV